MSGETHIPDMEGIAAHAGFVRALARSLLLDPNRADDVAQQAILTAIEREEGGIRRPRAWLARVTRNLVRRSFRSDRRRLRREEGAARPEPEPSAADTAARLETTERLVRAVRELREPYRETVVQRFFEGLTPERIAKREGVPASTVRGRLSRALAMLRERLDRDHGDDRRAWSLALLSLVLPREAPAVGVATAGAGAALVGGLAMSGKKIVAIAAVLIALSVGGAVMVTAPLGDPVRPNGEEILAVASTGQVDKNDAAPADPGAVAPDVAHVVPGTWPVRVKTNVPGASVTVTLSYYGGEPNPPPLVKRADGDGFAGFTLPERDDPLNNAIAKATAPGHGPAEARIENGQATLTLMAGRPLSGRVLDEAGEAIEGASVFVGSRHSRSDEEGRFTVHVGDGSTGRDGIERFPVNARHHAYLPSPVKQALLDDEVVLVLPRGRVVSGRIVDSQGRAVPGLWVVPGGGGTENTVRTGSDGSFDLGALSEKLTYLQIGLRAARMGAYPGGGSWGIVRLTGDSGVLHDVGTLHMVRVRVRDESGRPFRYASLTARDVPQGGWGGPVLGDTGDEGSAIFSAGSARAVEVTAVAPGRMPVTEVVKFDEDEVTAEVELVLRRPDRPGRLALSVGAEDGSRPRAVFLTLSCGDAVLPDFRGRRVDLDPGGRAVVNGVVPGDYTAWIAGTKPPSTDGFLLSATKEVRIEAGSETDLSAKLPIGGRVRVTVVNRQGEPVRPPSDITLRNERNWLLSGTLGRLDAKGFRTSTSRTTPVETFAPVKPGRAFVVIESGSKTLARQEIEVLAGKKLEVRVPIDR